MDDCKWNLPPVFFHGEHKPEVYLKKNASVEEVFVEDSYRAFLMLKFDGLNDGWNDQFVYRNSWLLHFNIKELIILSGQVYKA